MKELLTGGTKRLIPSCQITFAATQTGNNVFDWVKLIFTLVQGIIWPLIATIFLLYYQSDIKDLIGRVKHVQSGSHSIDFEVLTAAGALVELKPAKASDSEIDEETSEGTEESRSVKKPDAQKILETKRELEEMTSAILNIDRFLKEENIDDASGLWVDDKPDNIEIEREILEELGISVTTSENTEKAVEKVLEDGFDFIITDQTRGDDLTAGYTLINELKEENVSTPVIIYTFEKAEDWKDKKAFGWAKNPRSLFTYILKAIEKSRNI
ncbi:response regulator (plasmid) [Haladaptatus sp. SPP-AMP-3]|uniref:response regulator n=1 Tax=Haladaptatus sp. SPP-AMP-3 TaxID=3121295 RepID=UPI003C2BD641